LEVFWCQGLNLFSQNSLSALCDHMGLYGNFYKITIEWQCVTFEDALIVNTHSGTVHFFIVPKCYVSDIRIQVAACPQTSPVKKQVLTIVRFSLTPVFCKILVFHDEFLCSMEIHNHFKFNPIFIMYI